MTAPYGFTRSYQIIVNGRHTVVTEKEFERVQKLSMRQLEAQTRLLGYIAYLEERKMRRPKGRAA